MKPLEVILTRPLRKFRAWPNVEAPLAKRVAQVCNAGLVGPLKVERVAHGQGCMHLSGLWLGKVERVAHQVF